MDDMNGIYRQHAQTVYKFLLSQTRDPDLAEELTQETFYQAVRSIGRFDGSCQVSTWLCQIAKHHWYRELERRKKKGMIPIPEAMTSGEAALDEKLCLREEKMELFRKVHILDEVSKEIVFLRITGTFSFKEIGELFGKNENWARVTFYRAKQKIMKG